MAPSSAEVMQLAARDPHDTLLVLDFDLTLVDFSAGAWLPPRLLCMVHNTACYYVIYLLRNIPIQRKVIARPLTHCWC